MLSRQLQIKDNDWKTVARKCVIEILPITAWVLTLLNITYAVAHHFLLSYEISKIMTPLSAAVAVVIIGSDIWLHRLQTKGEDVYAQVSPHIVLFLYGLLNLVTAGMMFYLKGAPLETTSFMILCFGAASLMVSSNTLF